MKIQDVSFNNRRKGFDVKSDERSFWFPYAKLELQPTRENPIEQVFVDPEMGGEAFSYRLASGREGTVHIDAVLDYNRDPSYMRDLLLYRLTLEAQRRVEASRLSKREMIRRLGTSATQFYRLLDQTNYRKSLDQILELLTILDCDVEFTVQAKSA